MQEDPAEVLGGQPVGHPVAQPAGGYSPAVVLEVGQLLQGALGYEVAGVSLVRGHPREQFRHEQGEVVVHPHMGPDVSGCGHPAVIAGERVGQHRGVQVDDGRHGVEGALGQRALGASSGRGGGLTGHRRDELHEQLGHLHVMQRAVRAQRRRRPVGGVVPPPSSDHIHRQQQRRSRRQPANQARGQLRHCSGPGIDAVRSLLQVARVLRGLALHQPRVGRAHEVRRAVTLGCVGESADHLRHRLAEGAEGHGIVAHRDGIGRGQRREVGQERLGGGDVALGLLVVPPVDGVVGALKQQVLAILHELVRTRRIHS